MNLPLQRHLLPLRLLVLHMHTIPLRDVFPLRLHTIPLREDDKITDTVA